MSRLVLALALAAAACGRAPVGPPAHVVLVTIDTLRADHVNAQLTPALDRLAHEAVVFDQTITVAPLTLPAHASLLTGNYPPRHDTHTYGSVLWGYEQGSFTPVPISYDVFCAGQATMPSDGLRPLRRTRHSVTTSKTSRHNSLVAVIW